MPYELRCETCSFETEAAAVDEALRLERRHKRRYDDHRVTIERHELP